MQELFEYMDNNELPTMIISFLIGLVIYLWLKVQLYKEENKQFKKQYQENVKTKKSHVTAWQSKPKFNHRIQI